MLKTTTADCAKCEHCESCGKIAAWCLLYGFQDRAEIRRCGCDDFSDDSNDE